MEKLLNKITHGDCLEILKSLPNKSIDMILVDPPYFDVDFTRETTENDTQLSGNIKRSKNFMNSLNSKIKPQDWFFEALRVSKKVNWIVWLDYRHQSFDYLKLIKENGLQYYELTWLKPNPMPVKHVYFKDFERAYYIYKDSPNDFLETYEGRSTFYKNPAGQNDVKWHPTPKPLEITRKQILKHSKKGDIVLDFFSGSGTTAVACKQEERNFIAVELDEQFYQKSVERLEQEGSQLTFNF